MNIECVSCGNQSDPNIETDLPMCQQCVNNQRQMVIGFKQKQIQEGKLNPSIDEIIPNKLYLGNEDGGLTLNMLQERKITHILIAGGLMSQAFQGQFIYKQYENLNDSLKQNIKQHFEDSYNFINEGQVVYVHCNAGVNRSATLVIAYLMRSNNWTYNQAFDFVKAKRSVIGKNSNFVNQLEEFQSEILAKQNQQQDK